MIKQLFYETCAMISVVEGANISKFSNNIFHTT